MPLRELGRIIHKEALGTRQKENYGQKVCVSAPQINVLKS